MWLLFIFYASDHHERYNENLFVIDGNSNDPTWDGETKNNHNKDWPKKVVIITIW